MANEQCCENPPTLNSSSGAGVVLDDLAGFRAYVAGSPDSKLAILFVSDIFGFEAPNLRKLADKVAASGFYVVVPDYFNGDPFVPGNSERPLPVWLKYHPTDKGFEDSQKIIAALKNNGVSAVGAAGFCWGGKVVTDLAKAGDIEAVVLLHPSFVPVDDMKEVKCPIAILAAEFDHVTPVEVVKQYEQVLSDKPGAIYFVKIFNGASHGWTCRYDSNDPSACQHANEAHQNMLDWFIKYVK